MTSRATRDLRKLVWSQGDLYAGGLFSVEGSFETGGVARWNGAAWESVGGGLANPTFRGVVSDLALHQGAMYAAGCFTSAGGVPSDPKAIPARGVVRWTGTAWEAVADGDPMVSAWFSPLSCGDEGPAAIWDAEQQRLLSDGTRLYLGGFFPGLGGVPSQSIIAYEGGSWVAQGAPGNGLSGGARALAAGGPTCALHAMGGFSHAGKVAAQGGVARYDDTVGWSRVGPDLPKNTYCWTMAVDREGTPLLGCDLAQNDVDPPVGVVYRLVADAWVPLGDTFADGGVAAMGFDPSGALWVAGGGAKGFVASANGDAFTPIGAFDSRVGSIAFQPRKSDADPIRAVVGGYFTTVDDKPAKGVAHWNGSSWEALGDGFAGGVLAVAYAADGSIYASTPDDGTMDRMILGRWDGSAWHEVATPEPGPTEAGYAFNALLARGSYVVAAGFAWPGSDERNVFVYDGTSFQSLRGGATAISVDTMALAGSGLWLGGSIAEVGPPAARIPSVGIARLR